MNDRSRHIYMIGIGGIGMSALAQLYAHKGYTVSGSDRAPSAVSDLLHKKGITVSFAQEKGVVPDGVTEVVYSDAVHDDNPERVAAKARGIPQHSYFEALGGMTKHTNAIAVSGTHGKTTTAAMLVKILRDANEEPGAIIGSIVPEFGSNFLAGDGPFVVEACEYKDHLLKLTPHGLIITNIEWDHTDHFPSLEAMQETFRRAVARVPEDGWIVANPSDPNVAPVLAAARARVIDYTKEMVPELMLLGEFNRDNARAAKAAATYLMSDIKCQDIDVALADFKGTWRRFEYKGKTAEGVDVYDDYAHHPTAIRETLRAVREKFQNTHLVVAFHPHLYSRTRDFMNEFAEALALADEVILAPIYPAREEPIQGVTSDALAEKISERGTPAQAAESLEEVEVALRDLSKNYRLKSNNCIFITMGAGDIYKVAEALTTE